MKTSIALAAALLWASTAPLTASAATTSLTISGPGVDANLRYNLRNTSRTEMLQRGAQPGPFADQSTVRIGTFVSSLSAAAEWHRLWAHPRPPMAARCRGC